MGKFTELKISDQDLAQRGMTSLSGTRWANQAELLKAKLDEDGTFVAQKLGQVLDLIESVIAAESIGASVSSVPTKTVQAILTAFEAAIADRYTKEETDSCIEAETSALFHSVAFDSSTGDMTFTKKDGQTMTVNILTLVEHVPTEILFDQRYYTKAVLDPIMDSVASKADEAKVTALATGGSYMTELDDIQICANTATLSAGWTYVSFPREFITIPTVTATADTMEKNSVAIKGVTTKGFYAAIIGLPSLIAATSLTFAGAIGAYVGSTSSTSWIAIGPYTLATTGTTAATTITQGAATFAAGTIQYIACADTGVYKGA